MTSERLARCFAESAGIASDDPTALGAQLDALLGAGRSAWPKISLEPETFVEHLGRHAKESGSPLSFLEHVHASDLYLAAALVRHDRAALAYFEEQFMAHVPEYVMRVRVGRDVVDEVKQKLRERLLMGRIDERAGADASPPEPKIAEYSGKGALGGWLRVAAVRTALNQVRGGAQPADKGIEELSFSVDPELAYLKEHARDLFDDAFRRVLGALDPNERTILRLHYIEGLTMDQLSSLYKTPRSTIARRVAEAREQILAATETVLRDERGLSPSAVASVIRQARSQLRVTITRLFG